jgi:hypothetical protein
MDIPCRFSVFTELRLCSSGRFACSVLLYPIHSKTTLHSKSNLGMPAILNLEKQRVLSASS